MYYICLLRIICSVCKILPDLRAGSEGAAIVERKNTKYCDCLAAKGRRKKSNSCMSVNGGRVNPLSATRCFFLKGKKMQNVVKRKNMYLEEFQVILDFFPQNHTFETILNLLICISKIEEEKNLCPQKTGFCRTGGVRKIRTCP